jgi:hypothetical protein
LAGGGDSSASIQNITDAVRVKIVVSSDTSPLFALTRPAVVTGLDGRSSYPSLLRSISNDDFIISDDRTSWVKCLRGAEMAAPRSLD